MTATVEQTANSPEPQGVRKSYVIWIVLATILVTVAITYWVIRTYIYASDFTPVELNSTEQQLLNSKLRQLGYDPGTTAAASSAQKPQESNEEWLRPEGYTEKGAKREVDFSERELNSLISNNNDLAKKLAVDLGDDLVSARMLIPLDQDFPILGGKTLRVSAGVEMAFREAKPVVILKGVSIMGIPIPNAWLGGLKNIDLISEFGDEQGFWKAFAAGVDNIRIEDGALKIKLKE